MNTTLTAETRSLSSLAATLNRALTTANASVGAVATDSAALCLFRFSRVQIYEKATWTNPTRCLEPIFSWDINTGSSSKL
jgi:hypothetical protein